LALRRGGGLNIASLVAMRRGVHFSFARTKEKQNQRENSPATLQRLKIQKYVLKRITPSLRSVERDAFLNVHIFKFFIRLFR
jgi:hypothetical protein